MGVSELGYLLMLELFGYPPQLRSVVQFCPLSHDGLAHSTLASYLGNRWKLPVVQLFHLLRFEL